MPTGDQHDAPGPRQVRPHPVDAAYELLRGLLRFDAREHARLLAFLGRWTVLAALVGAMAGLASATFLTLLARATDARAERPWLLALLPLGGFAIGLAYRYAGGRSAQGNNLVLEAVHGIEPEPSAGDAERWVPRRLAPLALTGALVTHLLGGSAGREGTAVQMSGSLSDALARLIRLRPADRRLLLVAAIAGGFGSVFGVPLAGAVFALEVQTVGRIRHDALVPALVASVVGERVVHALDWHHHVTPAVTLPEAPLDPTLLAKVAIAGLAFGLASALFTELVMGTKAAFTALVAWSPLRPLLGGLVVVVLTLLVGTEDYLGLSLPLIERSFDGADLFVGAFLLKIVFTAVTLGSGFQGGEVTPLFVVGATLGATTAPLLDVPVELLAAVGFVAVFAAATNTPLACTVMGVELFGAGALVHLALGCTVAYVFSAHRGIYHAQRLEGDASQAGTLADHHDRRRPWLPPARRRT